MRKWLSMASRSAAPLHPGVVWRLLPLALLFAAVFTLLIYKIWNPHQLYPDVVTGSVAYQDLDKSEELTLMVLFLVSSVLLYYVFLRLTAMAIRPVNGESEWLRPLLDVPLALLAYWVGFQLVRFTWNEPPIEALASAGILFAVLLGLRRFSWLPRLLAQRFGLWILFDLLLLVFGGFGIGIMAAFAFPAKGLHPGSIALGYLLVGLCVLVAMIWRSATPARLVHRLLASTYVFQIPLPFLFFTVLQRDGVKDGVRIAEPASPLLQATIWLLCLIAWYLLYRRYRRQRKPAAGRVRAHVEPICLAAIAVCMAASNGYLPQIYMDDFHLGEQLLPWQQLTQFGSLPYIDLIPIHGAMSLLRSAMHSLFFGGSIATFQSADNLLGGVAAGITFVCLFRFGGLVPALLYCLCLHSLDRFYVLGPILLWMTRPRLHRSPVGWLALAAVLASFAILYNVPVGGALLIGLLPAVIHEAQRAWRGGLARMRPLLVGAVAVLLVIVTIPWARHTVSAFIRFAAENGAINTTANDIPWSGIPDVPSPSPEAITSSLLFSGLKFGWIAIALLAFALLANAASASVRSLARVRNRLLWAVGLACVIMLPWTAGRIDPGMSRTGLFSAYCAAVFLPVMVTRLKVAQYDRGTPRTALFIVVAALLGMYATETSMVSAIRLVAVRLSPVIAVPNNLVRVIGAERGLPNLGTVYISPDKLDELTRFNGEVSRFSGDRGTYFDLSNRQALYAFCRRKAPTMYTASYVAASYQQQEHMLDQLKANPAKVVFVSPGLAIDGPASLRTYLLYRYAVLNFRPCLVHGDLFMLDASIDRSQCEAVADRKLLDGAFSAWQLYGLPSAWGASWSSLEHLFEKWPVPSFASRVKTNLNWDGQHFTMPDNTFDEQAYLKLYPDVAEAVKRGAFHSGYAHFIQSGRAEGRLAPGLKRPFVWITLQDLNINPQQYDFLTFRFSCDSCELTKMPLEVIWKSDIALSKPIVFTVQGDRVLLPMGSYPQWLTAHTITALRLELGCAGCARSFRVSDLTLLHYRPAETVPHAIKERLTGEKTTSGVVSDAIIKGTIDAPKDGATVSRDFLIGGWAIAYGGSIKDVVISMDGKPPIVAGPSVPRPDVAAVFPDVPDAVDSGWTLVAPIREMQAGKHQVGVTVRLRDGSEEPLGTVSVTVVK